MPTTFNYSGKPAFMYDQETDVWLQLGGAIDTSAGYTWTGVHAFSSDVTFADALTSTEGINNFLNPAARSAAIPSPAHGAVSFIRQDAGGSTVNRFEYYNGSAWVANDGDISGVTAGTGLSGGGTAGSVTLSVDTTFVATTSNTMTMSNKTLTAPTLQNPSVTSGTFVTPTLQNPSVTSGTFISGTFTSNPTIVAPYIYLGLNSQTATSYTSVITDASKLVTMNLATANDFKIPTNASVAYAVGTTINVIQIGAGQTTISAVTSGTTTIASTGATATAPALRAQYSSATCIKVATDTWYVVGDIT
jgi:hypothetical protein